MTATPARRALALGTLLALSIGGCGGAGRCRDGASSGARCTVREADTTASEPAVRVPDAGSGEVNAGALATVADRPGEPVAPRAPARPAFTGAADLHVDLPYQVHYRGRSLDLGLPGEQVTAAGLRQGRVGFVLLSLFLRSGLAEPRHTYADLMALLATGEQIVSENRTLLTDEIAYLFSVEGSHALVGHEEELPGLVARGVLVYGLTHARHNALADSATDRRRGRGGLTDAGTRFVRAVYAAGGLIDVSHCSDEAFTDTAALARSLGRPLVATHSNARALTPHARNLTDVQLEAIAASGGVVGLNFHSPYLRGDGATASIADVVRHAQHMITVMGIEHVAIGSDLDGAIRPARGLESHAGLVALGEALVAAGVTAEGTELILGGNVARVLGPLLGARQAPSP